MVRVTPNFLKAKGRKQPQSGGNTMAERRNASLADRLKSNRETCMPCPSRMHSMGAGRIEAEKFLRHAADFILAKTIGGKPVISGLVMSLERIFSFMQA